MLILRELWEEHEISIAKNCVRIFETSWIIDKEWDLRAEKKSEICSLTALSIYISLLVVFSFRNFFLRICDQTERYICISVISARCISTFVDMNLNHLYQFSIKADSSDVRRLTALNLSALTISAMSSSSMSLESSNDSSERLQDFDIIKVLNMSDSLLKTSLDASYESTRELNDFEVVDDKVHHLDFWEA